MLPSIAAKSAHNQKSGEGDIFIPLVPKLESKTPRRQKVFDSDVTNKINSTLPEIPNRNKTQNKDLDEYRIQNENILDFNDSTLFSGENTVSKKNQNPVHYASGAFSVEASLVDPGILNSIFPDLENPAEKIDWGVLDSQMASYYLHKPTAISRDSKSRDGRSSSRSRGKHYGQLWGDATSSYGIPESDPTTLTVVAREQRLRAIKIEEHLHNAMRQFERLIHNDFLDADDKAEKSNLVRSKLLQMSYSFENHDVNGAAAALFAAATSSAEELMAQEKDIFALSEHSLDDSDQSIKSVNDNDNSQSSVHSDTSRVRGIGGLGVGDITGGDIIDDTVIDPPSPIDDFEPEKKETASTTIKITSSKKRSKLRNLSSYVNSHTYRKIKSSWNFIESKFKSSHHFRMEQRMKNGLSLSVKCPILSLYTLTSILCSSRAKIGPQEINAIYSKLGLKEEEIFNIRRVCALNVVIALDPENNLKSTYKNRLDLRELLKADDRMVTMDEFIDTVFPTDPNERESELKTIRENKQAELTAIMEEKKRKDERKEVQQVRISLLKANFEEALGQVQFMKAKTLTQEKYEEFCDLVETCKTQIAQHNDAKASQAPPDVVYFLGLDAFPESFQESYRAKNEITRRAGSAKNVGKKSASQTPSINETIDEKEKLKKFRKLQLRIGGTKPVGHEGLDLNFVEDATAPPNTPPVEARKTNVATAHATKIKANRRRSVSTPNVPVVPSKHYATRPYSLMSIFRQTVAIGRGISGWGYAEVACLLQYLASSRIACMYRCFRRRWRYTAARRMWKNKERNMRATHCLAWKELTKRLQVNRRYLLRQLVAWKYYTKRAKARRHIFKSCFWIFYKWRKAAEKTAVAKEKSRFLVGRVIPTILLLRVFGAWKKYQLAESDRFKKSTSFYRGLIQKNELKLFRWFREWAQARRLIRRAWMRSGRDKYNKQIFLKLLIPYTIWRAFVTYRKLLRSRVRSEFTEFRRHVLPMEYYVRPMALTSNADKRLFKARSEGKQINKGDAEDDEEEKDGKKKKKKSKHRKKFTGFVFNWKANTRRIYDVSSDGEDGEDIPAFVSEKYQSSTIAPMPMATSSVRDLADFQLSFLLGKDIRILRLVRGMYPRLCYADQWNLFEAAMRFHRFGRRAFNNLRIYAAYKVGAKAMRNRRIRAIKIIVFLEFKKIYDTQLGKANSIALSEAERLNYFVRSHLIQKTVRIQGAKNDIKVNLGREEDDGLDDEERAAKKMKMLNLIDPDDTTYLLEQKRQREQKEKERQDRIKNSGYVPPNLLEWDRNDRETELGLAERMVKFSESTNKNNVAVVLEADQTSAARVQKESRYANMLLEVLASESEKTVSAIQREREFVDKFWEHAADTLLTVLVKVYAEVQLSMMKEESKIYFRILRLPMLLSRSKSMLHRKKLANWIRICRRLNAISRKADFYFRKRQIWITLNRWLKFIEITTTTASPGLGPQIRRRTELFSDLNKILQKEGFLKVVYVDNRRLEKKFSLPHNILHRWKMYTQECSVFKTLERKVKEKYCLRLLQRCFWAIKTGENDNSEQISQYPPSFPIARLDADLEQIRKRFLVSRRRGLSQVITKYNRKFSTKIRAWGRSTYSFKKFIGQFRSEIQGRISAEQRLISQAFERRGTMECLDMYYPIPPPLPAKKIREHRDKDKDSVTTSRESDVKSLSVKEEPPADPLIPTIMRKISGRRFADPAGPPLPVPDVHVDDEEDEDAPPLSPSTEVPAGFKLTKIAFAMYEQGGIAGWQLFWSADSAKDIESPKRGNFSAVGIIMRELIVPKDDFFVGLEYLYDGVATVGVRLKLHFGGFTRWIGGKNSMSTLSVYLGAESSPRQEFESFRDQCVGKREKDEPAFPMEHIIGITGIVTDGTPALQRATGIGILVRKIIQQNLFSYYWVQDVLDKEAAAKLAAEKAAVAMKAAAAAARAAKKLGLASRRHRLRSGVDGESLDGSQSLDTSEASSKQHLNTDRPHSSAPLERPLSGALAANEQMKPSEVQFFDVLRMRSMEIDAAFNRAESFARKLWTSKFVQDSPSLSKLVRVRIISGLARWYFNGINKLLIRVCPTELQGQAIIKKSRNLHTKANNLHLRADAKRQEVQLLEESEHPWTGKAMLTPQDRELRKEYQRKLKLMKDEAQKLDLEGERVSAEAVQIARDGELLLPRLDLCTSIVSNYRVKIDAARHKASLLKNMSLDEMKVGLIGDSQAAPLLSNDMMKALNISLADSKSRVPKDVPRLDQLVDQLLASERTILQNSITTEKPYEGAMSLSEFDFSGREKTRRKPPLPYTSGTKTSSSKRNNPSANITTSRSQSTPMLSPSLGVVLSAGLGLGPIKAAGHGGTSPAKHRRKKKLSVTTPAVPLSPTSPVQNLTDRNMNLSPRSAGGDNDEASASFSLMSDSRAGSPLLLESRQRSRQQVAQQSAKASSTRTKKRS